MNIYNLISLILSDFWVIKVLVGNEDWWSVKQEPTLSPALALPPGGSELNNSAQSQVETRLKKQIHKKKYLAKAHEPVPINDGVTRN